MKHNDIENDIEKIFRVANSLRNEEANFDLLMADDLIDQSTPLKNIKKIELMGGKHPFRQDFLNIDIVAEKGIRGSALEVSKFIEIAPDDGTIIIINNPYSKTADNPDLFLNSVLEDIRKLTKNKKLGKATYVVVSGTPSNKFFNKINVKNKKITELEHWEIHPLGKLPDGLLQETEFFTANGREIDKNKMQTILLINKSL